MGHQFTADGANFEASTSYHRLSAEMVAYATALALGLPSDRRAALKACRHDGRRPLAALTPAPLPSYPAPGTEATTPFPAWYWERMERMAEFTRHITKPNGSILQIGDNDSGRFLKLQPVYHPMTVAQARALYANLEGYTGLPDGDAYWDEDFLDHRHLVAALNGFFARGDFSEFVRGREFETGLITHLAQGLRIASYRTSSSRRGAEEVSLGSRGDWGELTGKLLALSEGRRQACVLSLQTGTAGPGLQRLAYPDFGLFLFKSSRFYLAVRCGPIGQSGFGGHAHNDQLSLELWIDGVDYFTDPGTYLYTALPRRRNEYRSACAHSGPRIAGREPGSLARGLFTLGDEARARCIYFGPDGFAGVHRGYGFPVYRRILFSDISLIIEDGCEEEGLVPINLPRPGGSVRGGGVPSPSPKYGCRAR